MDLMSLCKIVINWRQGIKLAKVVGEHQNGSVDPSGRPFGEATISHPSSLTWKYSTADQQSRKIGDQLGKFIVIYSFTSTWNSLFWNIILSILNSIMPENLSPHFYLSNCNWPDTHTNTTNQISRVYTISRHTQTWSFIYQSMSQWIGLRENLQ